MIEFVNAKLNLGLNILRKRPDGYHELSTLFYPVGIFNGSPENPEPFCDILEINPSRGRESTYRFTGNHVDCEPDRNLAVKALRASCSSCTAGQSFMASSTASSASPAFASAS